MVPPVLVLEWSRAHRVLVSYSARGSSGLTGGMRLLSMTD